jgi:hypothetical protein
LARPYFKSWLLREEDHLLGLVFGLGFLIDEPLGLGFLLVQGSTRLGFLTWLLGFVNKQLGFIFQ